MADGIVRARRRFLGGGLAALAVPVVALPDMGGTASEPQPTLAARRLAWAGVQLELPSTTLLIDPVPPRDDAPAVSFEVRTARRYALVTHLHGDHFDVDKLRALLGDRGSLVCHDTVAADAASRGLRVRAVALYHPMSLGDFVVTPVPAVDGAGDDQVSWIVSGGGRRVIHCGDTLWHGRWWELGRLYGPFDAAFLPINGAVFRFLKPDSGVPAVLTPEQAVAAAVVLGARRIVPIHYGAPTDEGYEEVAAPTERLVAEGRRRGIVVELVEPGQPVTWVP